MRRRRRRQPGHHRSRPSTAEVAWSTDRLRRGAGGRGLDGRAASARSTWCARGPGGLRRRRAASPAHRALGRIRGTGRAPSGRREPRAGHPADGGAGVRTAARRARADVAVLAPLSVAAAAPVPITSAPLDGRVLASARTASRTGGRADSGPSPGLRTAMNDEMTTRHRTPATISEVRRPAREHARLPTARSQASAISASHRSSDIRSSRCHSRSSAHAGRVTPSSAAVGTAVRGTGAALGCGRCPRARPPAAGRCRRRGTAHGARRRSARRRGRSRPGARRRRAAARRIAGACART